MPAPQQVEEAIFEAKISVNRALLFVEHDMSTALTEQNTLLHAELDALLRRVEHIHQLTINYVREGR